MSQPPTSRPETAPGASTSGSDTAPGAPGGGAGFPRPETHQGGSVPDAPGGDQGFEAPGHTVGAGQDPGAPAGRPFGPLGGGPVEPPDGPADGSKGFAAPGRQGAAGVGGDQEPGGAVGPPGAPAGARGFRSAGQAGFRQAGPGGGSGGPADSQRARAALNRLRAEVGKVVVGQDPVVTGLVIALLCQGHVLLEGVPGVAKTLMVRALSAALALDTKRLQFTPDLMPGDVTGSLVYDARTAEFSFRPGPVFTNLLLADEINRTPPKTQASLLEAMEERQVSVEGEPRRLPDPFVVVATQNPIEYEGTYPLPEAQLDRFLLKLTVPLPSRDEEFRVLNNHHRGFDPRDLAAAGVTPVADSGDLAAGRAAVRGVQAAAEVLAYVVDLCRATRQSPSLSLGASPRGATALLSTAKAWAWLSGRDYVTPDDVKALARPTLRHRVAVRPEAELEGVTADGVLDTVLASVPAPR